MCDFCKDALDGRMPLSYHCTSADKKAALSMEGPGARSLAYQQLLMSLFFTQTTYFFPINLHIHMACSP